MAPVFNMETARVTELKIFENCIKGIMANLGQIATAPGQAPWKVVHVAGTSALRELARSNKLPKLPFLAIIVNAMRPSTEGYNKQAMYNGVTLGQLNSDTPDPLNIILHIMSTEVDIQIIAIAQDFADIAAFAQRLMFREPDMQFAIATDHYNLAIKVVVQKEMAIPELDMGEMGNLFTFQGGATYYAYTGVLELKRAPTQISLSIDSYNTATKTPTEINNFTLGGKTDGDS
jgi:hypothetical protein